MRNTRMKAIPYARQALGNDDIREALRALRSERITQGPKIEEFEERLCRYTGAGYAVAVSSGTAALHLALYALGAGEGDRILTSPITFSASANCAFYVGAEPGFVDIDDRTYHMDLLELESLLGKRSFRKRVKAVVPVHLMGTVSDMPRIRRICSRYGIRVVEDAAHALGANYEGAGGTRSMVGRCAHSDITTLSFHPIKQITTGEGGAVLTNSRKIYEKAKRARHHGITRRAPDTWRYDIEEIGYNYRITDFQSALGVSQLGKLDRMTDIRRSLVDGYNKGLAGVDGIRLPYQRPGTRASYHLYVIRVPAGKRDRLYEYLRAAGILTQVNYIPVHTFAYYRKRFGYKKGDFPVAERYAEECLSLPLYVGLTKKDQRRVISKVREFFNRV